MKIQTSFSEKAFNIFDGMLKSICVDDEVEVNVNSPSLNKALKVVCDMFGYKDAENFLNAYVSWDTEYNW